MSDRRKKDDMKTKIISRLIAGKQLTHEEFFDSLPDTVHSADVRTGYFDLFKKLNPVDPKTGYKRKKKDE